MKKPNHGYNIIRQNDEIVTTSQKHDANLQKNTTLYFQVGLIVCLLMVFGLLEMRFETTVPIVNPPDNLDDGISYNSAPNFRIEPDKKPEKHVQKKVIQAPIFDVVPDNSEMNAATKAVIDPGPTAIPGPPDLSGLPEDPNNNVDVPYEKVEIVPIYPGCEKEKTNEARRQCMSDQIKKLVQRKFNGDLASDLGLNGRITIQTQFTIDKKGHVTNIRTRAPRKELEKEAERVINYIPEMMPGKQLDKNVNVVYSLPIVFSVQN